MGLQKKDILYTNGEKVNCYNTLESLQNSKPVDTGTVPFSNSIKDMP